MEEVEVVVSGNTIKWFINKGYDVPTHEVQLWATVKGKRVKNGKKKRVKKGTKILVKVVDLPPSSNHIITINCSNCGKDFTTTFGAYKRKEEPTRCSSCAKKRIKGNGSHGYWVNKLVTNNPEAMCDISGESDKRFLVLHHLTSRSLGGSNTPDNYVVLSANYHMAFHNYCGGTNIPCTEKDYTDFKEKENKRKLINDTLYTN